MSLIGTLRDKWNTRKSLVMYNRIINDLKTGSPTSIVYLSTDKGYDLLFKKLGDSGYTWTIDGNYREGIFLSVRRVKK